jgi:hypothetical protein
MKNEVGRGHEFFYEVGIADIALVNFDLIFDMGDVGGRAGGHVVEDRDLVALGKECITEVRTDKTGSTGDENAHEVKSIGKAGTALKSAQGFGFLWLMSAGRDILKL